GVSKSGMCAMFHRRFYPDDVDVTVAFAAPILTGLPDPRFNPFFENELGDEACRLKIKAFQRRVLENRAGMLTLLADYGASFSIGLDAVLEYSVLEYWFSFFQYGTADCASIPGDGESLQTMFDHLDLISSPNHYSDWQIDLFKPFFYQAFTQLGYYSFITHHVRDLLVAVSCGDQRLLAPIDVTMNYDPQPMQDILNWLRNHGNNIIYIYGGHDPYTVAAVELTGTTNALKIIQPDADHGVRIQDLNEKQLVYDTLEEWLGVTVNRDASRILHRENQIYHHL
ncbi:MAG: hypothetical protein GY765_41425, partial [bacterium]|nr:hypothetical protein [bacterium]